MSGVGDYRSKGFIRPRLWVLKILEAFWRIITRCPALSVCQFKFNTSVQEVIVRFLLFGQ